MERGRTPRHFAVILTGRRALPADLFGKDGIPLCFGLCLGETRRHHDNAADVKKSEEGKGEKHRII